MMLQIDLWSETFAEKLKEAFGTRLKFLGYQGSYGRGEAAPQSDIDIVTVLDHVDTDDLTRYRLLVREMPHGELACGFLCGTRELYHWPKFDLYGLLLDTKPVWGNLLDWIPALTAGSLREALQIGVSNLYHAACHTYLYHENPKTALSALGKQAFFCLRFCSLLKDGVYRAAKKDLFPCLDSREKALLSLSLEPERTAGFSDKETADAYTLLLQWCGDILSKEEESSRGE